MPLRLFNTAALLTLGSAVMVATTAQAQVAPFRPGLSPIERHRLQVDTLRLQNETRRLEGEQRRLAADQMALEARLRSQRIEASRQPAVTPELAPVTPIPSSEASAARASAQQRRQVLEAGVGQIDAWLNRSGG